MKLYPDSSRKGDYPTSSGKDLKDMKQKQPIDIHQAGKNAYGGGHGLGDCCKICNTDPHFVKNREASQIPQASDWSAYGHLAGRLANTK